MMKEINKLFSYYGAKKKLARFYPPPLYDTVIEPFAGSAQYSLKYFDKNVILIDKYEVIVRLWKWLQKCSKEDILKLPVLNPGQSVDDFTFDCDEAKWLVGFNINVASASPKKSCMTWMDTEKQKAHLQQVANDLYKIRHWDIRLGDYFDAENIEATWFVDPPYQVGGEYYRHSSKGIDYNKLGDWCKTRKGQVIVCGNYGDKWLDFEPLVKLSGAVKDSVECICELGNHFEKFSFL